MLSGNLPQDLVIDILRRIPAKSLVRFNVVGKSWGDLFQDPSFIINHKKTRSANNGYCFFARQIRYGRQYSLVHRDGETPAGVRCEELVPFREHLVILAAADDMLFVQTASYPVGDYLWNPSTQEFRQVPSFKTGWKPRCYNLFGLGVDFKSNDVKVVTTFNIPTNETSRTGAAVWSSRTGSWREIINAEIPNHKLMRTEQLFAGGKCYWHISNPDTLLSLSILSFDFTNEKFRLIHLPDDPLVRGCDGMMIASELNQSIGYAVFQPEGWRQDEMVSIVTIWLISNENPVSWYKYITLTTPQLPLSRFDRNEKWLVCFEKEVVIMDSDGRIFFHNLITRETMSSRIVRSASYNVKFSGFHVLRESLISFRDGKM